MAGECSVIVSACLHDIISVMKRCTPAVFCSGEWLMDGTSVLVTYKAAFELQS